MRVQLLQAKYWSGRTYRLQERLFPLRIRVALVGLLNNIIVGFEFFKSVLYQVHGVFFLLLIFSVYDKIGVGSAFM